MTDGSIQPQCVNCRFAFDPWKIRDGKPLECRRFPPSHHEMMSGLLISQFPSVDDESFCGEFQPRPLDNAQADH